MKSKIFLIKFLDLYKRNISVFIKPSCVFYPTCSEYAKEAVEKYGAIKGMYLVTRRILRCHPWQKNHMDPVE